MNSNKFQLFFSSCRKYIYSKQLDKILYHRCGNENAEL